MRFPYINQSRTKNILHALQGFIIFLGWALTIAVFTRSGPTDGRTAYYFALCWFSIPALIYLTAVPAFPRTRRFGNVYAFAAVDGLFTLLWFVAWVCIASYVAAGKSAEPEDEDERKEKEGKSGCDGFAYGSPAKCRLSTGTCILGVFVFLLFALTFLISYRSVTEYRRTGMMPYDGSDPTFAAQSKAAFSSNVAHDFDEEDPDRDDRDFHSDSYGDGRPPALGHYHRDDDDYAPLQQSEMDDLGTGGRRPTPAYDPTAPGRTNPPTIPMPDVPAGSLMHDYDTSYGGPYTHRPQSPNNDYGYGR
ncbi:hypothetical protein VTO42DRAFT_7499 [Malbranchea cinnamomea]